MPLRPPFLRLPELKLQRAARLQRVPAREQLAATGPNSRNLLVGEPARRIDGEISGGYQRPAGALHVEQSHDALALRRFRRQTPSRAFPGGVVDFPTFCDESEESAPIPEHRLHREVRQIVKGEMR